MPRIPFIQGMWNGRNRRFRPDRLLVKLLDTVPGRDVAAALEDLRVEVGGKAITRRIGRWAVIQTETEPGVLALLERLERSGLRSILDFAEPDLRVYGVTTVVTAPPMPNDPFITPTGYQNAWQWGLEKMGMNFVWATQRGNETVFPVVADSGLDDHADLDLGRFRFGGNFLDEPVAGLAYASDGVFKTGQLPDEKDEHGHGTAMAGIVGGTTDNATSVAGMNWDSPVGVCRVLGDDNTGSTSGVLAAVVHCLQRASQSSQNLVINLSLVLDEDDVDRDRFPEAPEGSGTLEHACRVAAVGGAILVCGAGNNGEPTPRAPAAYADTFPDHVMAVGITYLDPPLDPAGEERVLTTFSPQGVTVVAPGNNWPVLAMNDGHHVAWGSSIAAAHVTGLASLLWSHRPDLQAADIVRILKETAYRPDGADPAHWGWGRVDGAAAIRALETRAVLSLVLDRSGSMGGGSGTAGMTRMEVLQAAADILVHSLEPRSHVGVIAFASDADKIVATTKIDPDTPDVVQNEVIAKIATLSPGGMTSIGAGVEAAAAQLADVADADVEGMPARAIFLFTDGRENHAPYVLPSAGAPAITPETLTGTPVHSVGTGTVNVVDVEAMAALASWTGGTGAVTGPWNPESEQAIAKFYVQALTAILGNETVLDPVGRIHPQDKDVEIEFPLTSDDQRVEVLLMRSKNAEVELSLRTPNGDLITAEDVSKTPGTELHVSERVVVFRVSLPSVGEGTEPAHAGTWSAVLRASETRMTAPDEGYPYTLIVNARSSLRLETDLDQAGTTPGTPFRLAAAISRPGESTGLEDLHAQVDVLTPDGRTVRENLKEGGPGQFEGSGTLSEEGAYRLAVRVEGLVEDRPFRRERLLTAAAWSEALDSGDRIVAPSDPPTPNA